ncbi:response regulator transcription factor [Limnospira fusiformis KN01]|uniref:Two component transcriptional regulator, winged helix family n=1 Tax=Limnospira maxima CS-328 TaxID=513049 RepID=B5W5N9_LIMMA|nr:MULTISPECIES: two-component system response regulator RppA [Limnospira]EKD10673.1 two component transcriptional regulator winged helix family [Arthrospira platensis C1]MDC0838028.1 response regulator transcription factor [Limnoraphis robusta]QJB28060.1 response regulator transcription factor [Limnospira fusiformis SAG 85.79]EDZ93118.1 two component transcriptional regulator, winged helix family [Limnospira maxima CS-328]MDT9199137.1 response regulator transcription factor [Limnospira sp. PM
MRILLVEDDPEQREPIHAALTRYGHIVDGVEDGTTALWLMNETEYDLLILDWMLPGEDGIILCKNYRQMGKTSPVLMLTAKDTTADKVMGLDAGADDYLVKPVDLQELLARIRALRRRSPLWVGDILAVKGLSLNLDTMILTWGNDSLKLKSRDFQLLEYMMRHPHQVLTHNQIEQALWEWGEEPESNAVVARVKRLRKTLKAIEIDSWIETVYGMGYRLEPRTD